MTVALVRALVACAVLHCATAMASQPQPTENNIGITHLTISRPGQPPEERVIDDKYLVSYDGVLVQFEKPVLSAPRVVRHGKAGEYADFNKALESVADGAKFSVVNQPNFTTADKLPAIIDQRHVKFVPVDTVTGNTTTLTSVPVSIGLTLIVDPQITDRSAPNTVFSRLYVTDSAIPQPPNGAESVTASLSADHILEVGDIQILAWELNGKHYALAVRLNSILDNYPPTRQ